MDTIFSTFYWLFAGLFWFLIAFWPATVAGRKGRSFIGFFILSIIFFPLAIILAYLIPDKRDRY